jgi:hypothetical protein
VTFIYSRITDDIRMVVSTVFKVTLFRTCAALFNMSPCYIYIPWRECVRNTLEYPPQDLSHNPTGNPVTAQARKDDVEDLNLKVCYKLCFQCYLERIQLKLNQERFSEPTIKDWQ